MRNINQRTILLSSTNPGKLREISELLEDLPIRLILPADIGIELEVAETGSTYAENATLKARAYAQASGLVALADDSGLEVDALGGQPGVYSARYSPLPDATDADRRAQLLKNLSGQPRPWTARFHCTVAIATPSGRLELADGLVEGEILPEERGSNGFGYDPIFLLPDLGLTMAELPEGQKNRISHRGLAVAKAGPLLKRLLEEEP